MLMSPTYFLNAHDVASVKRKDGEVAPMAVARYICSQNN